MWAVAAMVLVGLFEQRAVPREALLLDPNTYNRLPWYTGMVSSLGVLGWTVAATAAATGARLSLLADRLAAARFLRAGALLSILLLLDDLFQLHVVVSQALGQPKLGFYLAYALLGTAWVVEHRDEALRTRWPMMVAAGVVLAGSATVDQILPRSEAALVVEDALKFLGILAWAQYFVMTTSDIAASIVAIRRSDGPGHRTDGHGASGGPPQQAAAPPVAAAVADRSRGGL